MAALKIDISKAYDRLESIFLRNVMMRMGFSTSWIDRILFCVSSVVYNVRHNGADVG